MTGYALIKVNANMQTTLAQHVCNYLSLPDLGDKDALEYLLLKAGYILISNVEEMSGQVHSYSFVERPELFDHSLENVTKISNLLKALHIRYKIKMTEPEEIIFTN